jgi:hypothetical protein
MSEQSPETNKAVSPEKALTEEPEVEGHKAALNEDPSVLAKAKALDEEDGPEVEGHVKAFKPEDPSQKA